MASPESKHVDPQQRSVQQLEDLVQQLQQELIFSKARIAELEAKLKQRVRSSSHAGGRARASSTTSSLRTTTSYLLTPAVSRQCSGELTIPSQSHFPSAVHASPSIGAYSAPLGDMPFPELKRQIVEQWENVQVDPPKAGRHLLVLGSKGSWKTRLCAYLSNEMDDGRNPRKKTLCESLIRSQKWSHSSVQKENLFLVDTPGFGPHTVEQLRFMSTLHTWIHRAEKEASFLPCLCIPYSRLHSRAGADFFSDLAQLSSFWETGTYPSSSAMVFAVTDVPKDSSQPMIEVAMVEVIQSLLSSEKDSCGLLASHNTAVNNLLQSLLIELKTPLDQRLHDRRFIVLAIPCTDDPTELIAVREQVHSFLTKTEFCVEKNNFWMLLESRIVNEITCADRSTTEALLQQLDIVDSKTIRKHLECVCQLYRRFNIEHPQGGIWRGLRNSQDVLFERAKGVIEEFLFAPTSPQMNEASSIHVENVIQAIAMLWNVCDCAFIWEWLTQYNKRQSGAGSLTLHSCTICSEQYQQLGRSMWFEPGADDFDVKGFKGGPYPWSPDAPPRLMEELIPELSNAIKDSWKSHEANQCFNYIQKTYRLWRVVHEYNTTAVEGVQLRDFEKQFKELFDTMITFLERCIKETRHEAATARDAMNKVDSLSDARTAVATWYEELRWLRAFENEFKDDPIAPQCVGKVKECISEETEQLINLIRNSVSIFQRYLKVKEEQVTGFVDPKSNTKDFQPRLCLLGALWTHQVYDKSISGTADAICTTINSLFSLELIFPQGGTFEEDDDDPLIEKLAVRDGFLLHCSNPQFFGSSGKLPSSLKELQQKLEKSVNKKFKDKFQLRFRLFNATRPQANLLQQLWKEATQFVETFPYTKRLFLQELRPICQCFRQKPPPPHVGVMFDEEAQNFLPTLLWLGSTKFPGPEQDSELERELQHSFNETKELANVWQMRIDDVTQRIATRYVIEKARSSDIEFWKRFLVKDLTFVGKLHQISMDASHPALQSKASKLHEQIVAAWGKVIIAKEVDVSIPDNLIEESTIDFNEVVFPQLESLAAFHRLEQDVEGEFSYSAFALCRVELCGLQRGVISVIDNLLRKAEKFSRPKTNKGQGSAEIKALELEGLPVRRQLTACLQNLCAALDRPLTVLLEKDPEFNSQVIGIRLRLQNLFKKRSEILEDARQTSSIDPEKAIETAQTCFDPGVTEQICRSLLWQLKRAIPSEHEVVTNIAQLEGIRRRLHLIEAAQVLHSNDFSELYSRLENLESEQATIITDVKACLDQSNDDPIGAFRRLRCVLSALPEPLGISTCNNKVLAQKINDTCSNVEKVLEEIGSVQLCQLFEDCCFLKEALKSFTMLHRLHGAIKLTLQRYFDAVKRLVLALGEDENTDNYEMMRQVNSAYENITDMRIKLASGPIVDQSLVHTTDLLKGQCEQTKKEWFLVKQTRVDVHLAHKRFDAAAECVRFVKAVGNQQAHKAAERLLQKLESAVDEYTASSTDMDGSIPAPLKESIQQAREVSEALKQELLHTAPSPSQIAVQGGACFDDVAPRPNEIAGKIFYFHREPLQWVCSLVRYPPWKLVVPLAADPSKSPKSSSLKSVPSTVTDIRLKVISASSSPVTGSTTIACEVQLVEETSRFASVISVGRRVVSLVNLWQDKKK